MATPRHTLDLYYPSVAGAPAVTVSNSLGYGTWWNVAYTDAKGNSKSCKLLAIDVAPKSYSNMPTMAMNDLAGGQAILGTGTSDRTQCSRSSIGLRTIVSRIQFFRVGSHLMLISAGVYTHLYTAWTFLFNVLEMYILLQQTWYAESDSFADSGQPKPAGLGTCNPIQV